MTDDNNLLKSPVFTPRPGWGGKLQNWSTGHRRELIMGAFVVVIVLGAVFFLRSEGESIQATPSPTPATGQITVTAQPRDSVTSLARKALNVYLERNAIELNAVQKLYIETELKNSVGETRLSVGQSIIFSEAAIQRAISKSRLLNDFQIKYFSRFLQ